MNEFELKERILKGEDLHTEFKESLMDNEDIAKSIVCFANTDGGQIVVGVNDNGEIVGVENIDEHIRGIDGVVYNRYEPPVTIIQETLSIENKTILIINVLKGDQRPYRTARSFYYIRNANRCRQASGEELLRLFQATESIYYDEIEISRASIKDIDMEYAKKFLGKYFKLKVEDENLITYVLDHLIPTLSKDPFFA